MNIKITHNHSTLITKIEKLTINNTSELCIRTKHIDFKHEAQMDETKISMEDMRDDVNIVQSEKSKTINDMNFKLNNTGNRVQ